LIHPGLDWFPQLTTKASRGRYRATPSSCANGESRRRSAWRDKQRVDRRGSQATLRAWIREIRRGSFVREATPSLTKSSRCLVTSPEKPSRTNAGQDSCLKLLMSSVRAPDVVRAKQSPSDGRIFETGGLSATQSARGAFLLLPGTAPKGPGIRPVRPGRRHHVSSSFPRGRLRNAAPRAPR
jgi:hypothetical protein